MTRWICFTQKGKPGSYCRIWHMVFEVHGRHRILCDRAQLLGRPQKHFTEKPARLCLHCLNALAWRGKVGWDRMIRRGD